MKEKVFFFFFFKFDVNFTYSQYWPVYEFQVYVKWTVNFEINFPGRLESGLKHTEKLFNNI